MQWVVLVGYAALIVSITLWRKSELRADEIHVERILKEIREEVRDFPAKLRKIELEKKG